MSLLDNLKDLGMKAGILEDVPDAAVPGAPAKKAEIQKAVMPSPTQTSPVTPTTPIVLTTNDSEYGAIIQDALKTASTDVIDFFKFKLAVDALSKFVPDEASRYATAFATSAATAGITAEQILASASKFDAVIADVKDDFTKNYLGSLNGEKEKTSAEAESIKTEIDSIAAQIASLTEKQNELVTQRISKLNDANVIQERIETSSQNFESALYRETAKLAAHKSNIEKFLLGKV
jgi:hypothetical protein